MMLFFRLLGILQFLVILVLLGTLIVPLMIRASNRRAAAVIESLAKREIVMTCPRCTAEQRFSNGPCWCTSCKFTMLIEIEEPRCECGYLLYQLQGDACPECGRVIQQPAAQLG